MSSFKKLQEVLQLVRQTGDRIIVLDHENEPFVVMDLTSYRSLLREEVKVVGLTEEELLEKINRLIATWKNSQPDLAEYDLAQFRVDTIRVEPEIAKTSQGRPSQDELLAQVIDNQPLEDDKYYPEPEV